MRGGGGAGRKRRRQCAMFYWFLQHNHEEWHCDLTHADFADPLVRRVNDSGLPCADIRLK